MANVIKWLLIAAIAIVVFGAVEVFRRMEELGQFVTLEKVVPGDCRTIPSPPGVEDLVVDRTSGMVFLSSDDRRAGDAGAGGIFLLDPKAIDTPARLLIGSGQGAPEPFHPQGLSLYTAPDGTRTLMVVNHVKTEFGLVDPKAHAVEIFDVTGTGPATTLKHRRTVTSDLISSPADLVAMGPDAFYVTNGLGSETAFGARLELLLGLTRANVVWFDGETATKVVADLGFANGINVSPDGQTVYVAETAARRLNAFRRDPATGALTLVNQGFFGTGLDNIDVAPDGALWIGAHPRLIDFVSYMGDPAARSPSQILRVEPQAGGAARSLYTDEGSQISGVTAAVEIDRTIIAGTYADPRLLVCAWTATPEPPQPL